MTTDQPPAKAAVARSGLRVAFPVVWRYMSARYDFTEAAVERSRTTLLEALDRIESERGGRDYLVGESFTVADLTAASLLYPLVWPPQFQYELPEPPAWEFLGADRDHPALDWIREMWRRHRGLGRRPIPALRARVTLERALDLLGDPAPVIRARLRRDLLIVEVSLVDAPGEMREVITQLLEALLGLRVVPGDSVRALATGVEIGGGALPFTFCAHVPSDDQNLLADVLPRDVDRRRAGGLQNPQGVVVRLTIAAASEPLPALKYQLLPPFIHRRPGNAVLEYGRAMIQYSQLHGTEAAMFEEEWNKWLELPLDEFAARRPRARCR